ncbi:MAG: DNA polymerase III subunit delta [Oscillospiraceae bacterium]|nr:DNA polymerase III subunit delta [Oscillospiraceae bacterium]
MGFEALLGNERLKDNLRSSLGRGKASHFYLISGPAGSGKRTLARLLAAALMCEGANPPCGTCSGCRKIANGLHPDFITVDDPEKKTVPVDLIRKAMADIYIQPNEGKRKIYLLPRGQDLNLSGQNALLKILEEPPPYGAFLLLTDNPERLLPTVRSRCVELALRPLDEPLLRRELERRFPGNDGISAAISRSGGYLGQAIELLEGNAQIPQQTLDFCEAFTLRNTMTLVKTLVSMEKWKRDQWIPMLQQWTSILEEALASRSGGRAISEQARAIAASRSSADILSAIRQIQKCTEYAQGNVSCAAISGYLQWVLR